MTAHECDVDDVRRFADYLLGLSLAAAKQVCDSGGTAKTAQMVDICHAYTREVCRACQADTLAKFAGFAGTALVAALYTLGKHDAQVAADIARDVLLPARAAYDLHHGVARLADGET